MGTLDQRWRVYYSWLNKQHEHQYTCVHSPFAQSHGGDITGHRWISTHTVGYTIGNPELGSRNLLYYNRQWAFLHLFWRETLFLSSSTETAQKKKTISASLTKHVDMQLMESCLPKGWRICHHLQVTKSLSPTLFISPYLPPILPWTSINRLKKNALCSMDVKKIYLRFF